MLTLLQFAPALDLRNPSPFCLKADALLHLSGLAYETAPFDVRQAPKGRLPVLRDGDALIADSTFIRRHLETHYGIDFDAGLSPSERAVAHAFTVLCEDHLYWALVTSRWRDEANWPVLRDAFFGDVPALIRPVVTRLVRRSVLGKLAGQGFGAHSEAEVYALASSAVDALARRVADGPYLMGDVCCGADATVFGLLYSIVRGPLHSPLRSTVEGHPGLLAYVDRLEGEWFPTV